MPHARRLYFVQAPSARAAPVVELVALAKELDALFNAEGFASVEEAIRQAIAFAAEERAVVVICGTFFIMDAARYCLGYNEPRDLYDLQQ
jgi:folylpolyglutamate synthase/dihydropteroate synthase